MGRNSTTLNTFFVGQIGDDPTIDGLEFQYNWQFKHELSHRVAFGVEAFGEIEDLAHPGSFTDQLHRAGPVIYLNFGEEEEVCRGETRERRGRARAEIRSARIEDGGGCLVRAVRRYLRRHVQAGCRARILKSCESERWLTTQK